MENVFVFEGTNTLATDSIGDTLVQTDFTNGASIERIDAYQWGVAPAGTQVQPGSPLRQIGTGADCDLAPANDNLCGQVNRNPETVPPNWPQLTVGATNRPVLLQGVGRRGGLLFVPDGDVLRGRDQRHQAAGLQLLRRPDAR